MWLSLYNSHRPYGGKLYHKEVRKKMPLYEYQCRQCQDQFELLQPMNVTTEEIANSMDSGRTDCATPVG
ncbi:hypothetical protein CMK13_14805 [Candidatus Poribacteria bacterium]|nr:hypothetical protein [Candidatus Poribacteria bacterium]OUT57528.1 MAG: hypothetical protein CBB75_14170 [bacterium TMED15]